MARIRIAAVTGGNRGIGLAIVRNVALSYANSPLNSRPLLIYLTARSKQRGEEAVESLRQDQLLRHHKVLNQQGGLVDVRYRPLDVACEDGDAGIATFVDGILGDHGGLDMLVNNAGIAVERFDSSATRQTLQTNYYGTLSLTQRFLPHMKPGTRIVNIASLLGKLNKYPPSLEQSFRNAVSSSSIAAITNLMSAYQTSMDAGTHENHGWPKSAYVVSKTGVIATTMILGRLEKEKGQGNGVLVNCCCPGYVKTEMTKGRGRKDVNTGAKTPVMLALRDIGGVNGEFWENERVSRW